MEKVTLEFGIDELEGADCLFKIKGELIEGTIIERIDGYLKITSNSEGKWYAADDVEVIKILFRD